MTELVETVREEEKDLQLQSFATLTALKGEQFGKQIFTALLKFREFQEFLKVFPEVQRGMNTRKVSQIKTYILSGVELNGMRFFSSLTATARGQIFYDADAKRMAIDTSLSKLSLNDGQHRVAATSEAISELRLRSQSKRLSAEERKEYENRLNRLENMCIPIVIFNNLTETEEKQLFFDLNDLLTKPSRSTKIRLSQKDF